MFFTHLPEMPEGMNPEQITQANEWLQTNVDSEMWTSAEVCKHFKFSGARLNQLNKEHVIPGHIKFGATHVYLMRFAGPWFAAYKKRADVRKVKVEAPNKKSGRPKKVKGEYEYTLWGSVYKTANEPREEMLNWKGYVAAQYPQFYEGGDFKKVIGELIKDQPPELKNALKEIDHVFRKIIAERAK